MGHCGRGRAGPVDRCLLRALLAALLRGGPAPRDGRGPGRPPFPVRSGHLGLLRKTDRRAHRRHHPPGYLAQFGAISPDGQYLAIGGSVIRDLRIASIEEKRVVRKFAIRSGNVEAVAYSPDGRYLATGRGFMSHRRHNESVNLWDARTGRLIRNFPGPKGPETHLNDVTTLAFSPDGRILAVSYEPQPDRAGRRPHL